MLGFTDPMPYMAAPEPVDADAVRAEAAKRRLLTIAETRKSLATLADAMDALKAELGVFGS